MSTYTSAGDAVIRSQELLNQRSKVQIYDSGDASDYKIEEDKDSYVDLMGLALELENFHDDDIASDARDLVQKLNDFIAYKRSQTGTYWNDYTNETIAINLDKSKGLAIYYPYSGEMGGKSLTRYLGDDLFPNLTPNWGWKDFLMGPISMLTQEQDQPRRTQLLKPLVYELYTESANEPVQSTHTVYLPVITR
ncbi:MAG: hypothetical protein AAF639_44065 [Chloroflexota bacterium]